MKGVVVAPQPLAAEIGRTELGGYTLFDEALSETGFDLREMPTNYAPGFGRKQLISIDGRGQFRGASDPRRDGGVAAHSPR